MLLILLLNPPPKERRVSDFGRERRGRAKEFPNVR